MPTTRNRLKMKRTQISLLPEQFEAAKRIAQEEGVSISQVFRDALESVEKSRAAVADEIYDPFRGIIGIGEDCDPRASEDIDEVLYGPDFR